MDFQITDITVSNDCYYGILSMCMIQWEKHSRHHEGAIYHQKVAMM